MSKKRYKPLPNHIYEELRTLIEELDLVPLSIFPPETHELVKEYYHSLTRPEPPFDPITNISINVMLRNRKKLPKDHSNDLMFFDPCV